MLQTMEISLVPFDAARVVLDHVQASGMTVECVGQHATATDAGHQMAMLLFEKYYIRTSSRASLTVLIENLTGPTKVVFRGSGGGEGALFRFDWGAASDFAASVVDALEPYAVV
ncbi:hypothetical protein KZX37_07700 [Microbacterium sp. EYE_5]|uniref:DUF6054 family protein n=1 Tax=unclassified Microbacterium TaxID=2609290 RepID=UPI002006471B|nr:MULTISPECIES: DUF6054 family protein [unclassified Microbacterium]MCK6081604.1 hypothetical protein [Microbacterium sp. EYE_382]MCK6086874.1 hypothetical protein [Microbacterium sp. EYE_384]MCK6123628.1 hypothetical protein [Microbacterium sp. EYE_80]MCK6126537.1 hypothetical protein [Microbacterium sp. EYE_79]MCK6142558.1 hypothetical protein [Microbacterium sp. EYE_39]